MATVGHYEIPLGTDSYYVSANKQLSPMYDKSKKTWSQRLKITKTDKSPTIPLQQQPQQQQKQQQQQYQIDYSQSSALSRSMKYAEPWLYGTVRGIPARPVHQHGIFTPIPSEVAIMVCSCPEYLNGTKRELKKASICKKCKGSRLPLAPIGGTVRIRPTSTPIIHTIRNSAGTMRLPSITNKFSMTSSRPTILDSQNDPYDVMRRTRLLSPEPALTPQSAMKTIKSLEKNYGNVLVTTTTTASAAAAAATAITTTAENSSPTRGRSRHRINTVNSINKIGIESIKNMTVMKVSSVKKSSDQMKEHQNLNGGNKNLLRTPSRNKQDRWLDNLETEIVGRRSILHCDVNPYELISSSSLTKNHNDKKNNKISLLVKENVTAATSTTVANNDNVDNDDDDYDDVSVVDNNEIFNTLTNIVNNKNPILRTSNITKENSLSTIRNSDNGKFNKIVTSNYKNVQAIAGQRISLGEKQISSSLITQNGENFLYDNVSLNEIEENNATTTMMMMTDNKNISNVNEITSTYNHNNNMENMNSFDCSNGSCNSNNDSVDNCDDDDDADNNNENGKNLCQPKRPPRRKTDAYMTTTTSSSLSVNDDDNNGNLLSNKNNVSNFKSSINTNISNPTLEIKSTAIITTNNQQKQNGIKSILKRPSSVISTASSTASENDNKYSSTVNSPTNAIKTSTNCLTSSSSSSAAAAEITCTVVGKNITNTTNNMNIKNTKTVDQHQNHHKNIIKNYEKLGNIKNSKNILNGNCEININKENSLKNNSQFYLPPSSSLITAPTASSAAVVVEEKTIATVPQARKKVQFMVEDKIIQDDSVSDNKMSPNGFVNENITTKKSFKTKSIHNEDIIVADECRNDDNERLQNDKFINQMKQNSIIEELQSKSQEYDKKDTNDSIEENFNADDNALPTSTSRHPLSRRNSDRYTNGTAVILNFNDTMALRVKNNSRTNSKEIFAASDTSETVTAQQLIFRPKEPPPPPPPPPLPPSSSSATRTAEQSKKSKESNGISGISTATEGKTSTTISPLFNKKVTITNGGLTGNQHYDNVQMKTVQQQQQQNAYSAQQKFQNNFKPLPTSKVSCKQQQQTNNIPKNGDNLNENKFLNVENVQEIVEMFPLENPNGFVDDKKTKNNFSNLRQNKPQNKLSDETAKLNENQNFNIASPSNTDNILDKVDEKLRINDNNLLNKKLQAQNEISHGARIFGTTTASAVTTTVATIPQKTIVRVAPFNKILSDIHRLKINHTDDDFNMNNQHNNNAKKTSILINGDDCYSTVNVTNDTQIYQSSVVVTDGTTSSNDTVGYNHSATIKSCNNLNNFNICGNDNKDKYSINKPTTNTITINVSNSNPRTPEEEIIYKNNKINTLLNNINATKSIIPINNNRNCNIGNNGSGGSNDCTDDNIENNDKYILTGKINTATSSIPGTATAAIVKNKRNGGRTLIKLDFEKNTKQTDSDINGKDSYHQYYQHQNSQQLFSHEEELVKILRNPVEAVRRNLIPHVCGKSNNDSNGVVINNNMSKKNNNDHEDIDSNNKKEQQINNKNNNIMNDTCSDGGDSSSSGGSISNIIITNSSAKKQQQQQQEQHQQSSSCSESAIKYEKNSFIGKLLEDPTLNQLAEGLDSEVVIKLIENSLKRLKENHIHNNSNHNNNFDTIGTKDNNDMTKLIDLSLQKIKEERHKYDEQQDRQSNRGSISSGNSYSSANNYELFDFDHNNESDCYQSCSSELTTKSDDDIHLQRTSKFYQMLVDATLSEIEITTNAEDDDHHYESIRLNNGDPIYEEINEIPPPLPLTAPPIIISNSNDIELLDKKSLTTNSQSRSMFEGASKYDILSYLVDAKERGIVREESYEYNFSNTSDIIIEEEIDTISDLKKKELNSMSSRNSHLSITSDSSEDTSLTSSLNLLIGNEQLSNSNHDNKVKESQNDNEEQNHKLQQQQQQQNQHQQRNKPTSIDIERNDSGVGSETSKSSRSKYQNPQTSILNKNSPIHLCEDCDGPVETQITDSGVMYAPLVCRKCSKKRAERKEIITEIVETEEKYGRDLQIILEEFCQPMFVAGLLTQEQLSAIFLNTEELLENNQALAERMRDSLDIALEQGDDDLLTVNIGKTFLESSQMLHAFENYCVRQAASSLLLANLEKEKELLRIFLRVSQMENTVLRRMNLNSFLMVPVQRVTKYPLLLARLYKVTPNHLEGKELLKQSQEKIELHLNHINQEAKDVPTKLWRRISSSSPNRRSSCEIDMINIKLRKIAIDILDWNHDEVRFAMEGKLLYTQPTDGNWKKGRTIKLTPVNALLVTNGKPTSTYKAEKGISDQLNFPKHTGIREASLLLIKEKCGRYTLIREPLYLDKCVVCTEADWDDYFEVHEISSKDTFIFKAEDGVRTKNWYKQLQYHAQGMGAWRKRRNALANIMINGMLSRT